MSNKKTNIFIPRCSCHGDGSFPPGVNEGIILDSNETVDWDQDYVDELEKKNLFLIDIIKDLLKNEEYCSLCGCSNTNHHPKFCRIGMLKRNGDI